MYITKPDIEFFRSHNIRKLEEQYYEKFGEYFPCFNYVDFLGTETKLPSEIYKETLEKALLDDKPYCMVSHWLDDLDH